MSCPTQVITAVTAYCERSPRHELPKEKAIIQAYFSDRIEVMLSAIETWPEKCHLGLMFYLRIDLGVDIGGVYSHDNKTMWYKYRRNADDVWRVIKPMHCRDLIFEAKYFWNMPFESVFGVPRKPIPLGWKPPGLPWEGL